MAASGQFPVSAVMPPRREQGMLWGVKTRMDKKPVWLPWPASVTWAWCA